MSGKLQRVDKMADESRGANTKHRVEQWALIRTESNTYYHDIHELQIADICERKLKFLSKITPRLRADFAG